MMSLSYVEQAELKGSDTVGGPVFGGDKFGSSVAMVGDTVVVGAYGHDSRAGRAYVFDKTPSGWQQTAELKGSGLTKNALFGLPVAISGATILVGAPTGGPPGLSRAYVFTKTGPGWHQVAELKGTGGTTFDGFGSALAVSGDTAVVGAYFGGRAFVYTKTAAGWQQTATLKGPHDSARDYFGESVALLADLIVVGAPGSQVPPGPGRVYVFTKAAAGWQQTAELKGSDAPGNGNFGLVVAGSGSIIVVGRPQYANGAGRAYVFTKTVTGWQQTAELKGTDTVANDSFGSSVAITGTTVVVGAPERADGAGRAYLFTKTASGWHQVAELTGPNSAGGNYGASDSISGTTLVIGEPGLAGGGGAFVLAS
jgi:hypothetical protein